MHHFRRLLTGLAMLIGMIGTASAVTANFEDHNGNQADNTPIYMNMLCHPSQTWLFDLDNDVLEVGDVAPDNDLLTAALTIDVQDDNCDPLIFEIASLTLDGTTVWSGEVNTGISTLNVLSWVADHVLNVQVCTVWGDFWVNSMVLHGTYDNGVPSGDDEPVVPEPATLAMLGLGLSGLGILRRRHV